MKIFIIFLFLKIGHPINDKSFLDQNRKLQNIVIKIYENMDEKDEEFVDSIKKLISDASIALYEATSNMGGKEYGVKFGKVSIIIPSHWKLKGDSNSGLHCGDAQINILPKTPKNIPFTKQLRKCGISGEYISIPTDILKLTGRGRQIMREYVKLRYGVYDEEVINNQAKVLTKDGLVNSVCNSNIELEFERPHTKMIKCTDSNDLCHFKIKKNQNHNYSVMFDTETPSSKYFCDDKNRPHNKYAKNYQNKLCNQKSITSVILNHTDFKNVFSFPKIYYELPTFNIIQTKHRKIVLILDISGSMADVNRRLPEKRMNLRIHNTEKKMISYASKPTFNEYIATMKNAIKEFVNNLIEDTAEIGLVTFSDSASKLSDMIPMNKMENKKIINNLLDNIYVHGGTNIGHGLQIGVEVLGGTIFNNATLDGTLLLLSDGENHEENEDMPYNDIVDVIVRKSIQTNVVSYNQSDVLLTKLTRNTGGNFVHVKINSSSLDIMNRFARALESCDGKLKENTVLKEKIVVSQKSGKRIPFIFVDKLMGDDRKISISISSLNASKYDLKLTTKNNMEIKLTAKIPDNDKVAYCFSIPNSIKSGNLYVEFIRKGSKRVKRSLKEKSFIYSLDNTIFTDDERRFHPEAQLSHSFVEEVNGNTIITATVFLTNFYSSNLYLVRVSLEIELPNSIIVKKKMMDDGLEDDSIKGDLVFTKLILPKDISKKGVYNFKGIIEIYKEHSLQILRKDVIFNSLLVKNVSPSAFIDKIPPAQMEEPVIKILKNKLIKLKTIATGNDGMEGKISKYEILIRSSSDCIIEKSVYAEPYERIEIILDISNIMLQKVGEISIRGVDYNGNFGMWSFGVPLIVE